MTCGLCGSGITADEKFKKQKNGNIHRYVYYGCTKKRDLHCKSGYIKEEELVSQFEKLMDTINLEENEIKGRVRAEVNRFKKFHFFVLGKKERINITDVDVRTYAKYLLQEGTPTEKRELLSCLKGKIFLKNKMLSIAE